MRDTTKHTRSDDNSSRTRRVSRKERDNSFDAGDIDIDALLRDSGSNSKEDSNLESIFRRQVTNPFSTIEEAGMLAAQEKELEDLSKADNTKIFTTGYSIHLLTPYMLIAAIICLGFIIVDQYFFNIIEYLSEDIRYKIPAYGVMILIFSILIYLFIRKCLEYMSFEMTITKYKIVQGSKRTTVKNEIPYYSIQEFINDRGLFGRVLNYGNLSIYLTTRRTVSFERLHGAQYVYDLIQRLRYGNVSGILEEDDQISAMISGASKIEAINKKRQEEQSDSLDLNVDLSDLGFSEEELRELGMSSSSLSSSKSSKNTRYSESAKNSDIEDDVLEVNENKDDSLNSRRSSRSSRASSRRSRR